MACDAPFDAFRIATEYLGEELYRRASARSVWLPLIPRDEYTRGAGLTLSTFTIGRSEPTSDIETWSKVSSSLVSGGDANGGSGFCKTNWNDVDYGFEEVQYSPEQFGLRGPIICQDDLIYNFKADRFLEAYLQALTIRSMRSIDNRYQNIYSHLVPKNVTDASFTWYDGGSGTLPTTGPSLCMNEATCELTQEMLDTVAAEHNELGATNPNSSGWIDLGQDGPIYPLLIGQLASQRILYNNADLRQDAAVVDAMKGTEAAMVFKRLGASKVIKNYRHVINLFPPRYIYVGKTGCYQRINTWVMSDGTKGHVAEINPDWKGAPFEAAFVLNPWVFTSEIIRPVNAAAGLSWTPKNYFGEWMWVTGGQDIDDDVDCYDPTKKLGRHFAEYKHAPKPVFPEFGRMIIFRRCPADDYECPTCVS